MFKKLHLGIGWKYFSLLDIIDIHVCAVSLIKVSFQFGHFVICLMGLGIEKYHRGKFKFRNDWKDFYPRNMFYFGILGVPLLGCWYSKQTAGIQILGFATFVKTKKSK